MSHSAEFFLYNFQVSSARRKETRRDEYAKKGGIDAQLTLVRRRGIQSMTLTFNTGAVERKILHVRVNCECRIRRLWADGCNGIAQCRIHLHRTRHFPESVTAEKKKHITAYYYTYAFVRYFLSVVYICNVCIQVHSCIKVERRHRPRIP